MATAIPGDSGGGGGGGGGGALEVLVCFGRIGLFALGGGNAMTKLIEAEVVGARGWLTIEEFGSLFGLAFLFPGLTQVKLAAMIGQKVAGLPGVAAAVIGLNLPGLVLSVACWAWLSTHHDSPAARKLMLGMRYGAVAMLAAALLALARPLAAAPSVPAALLALVLFVAVAVLNLSTFGSVCAFAASCLLLL
jgi:chromate transporter